MSKRTRFVACCDDGGWYVTAELQLGPGRRDFEIGSVEKEGTCNCPQPSEDRLHEELVDRAMRHGD